jgi:hypothetical protein
VPFGLLDVQRVKSRRNSGLSLAEVQHRQQLSVLHQMEDAVPKHRPQMDDLATKRELSPLKFQPVVELQHHGLKTDSRSRVATAHRL